MPPPSELVIRRSTEDVDDGYIYSLEQRLTDTQNRLNAAELELAQTRRANAQAISTLRKTLTPLYGALRLIFGEMDKMDGGDSEPASAANPRTKAVWEMWKQRLGGSVAKVIDALLVNKELNTQQLAMATGLNRNTVPGLIMKLNKAGLINKNGGRFSLKEL